MLNGLKNRTDLGLLILRLGIGVMFIYHGLPKILGGPAVWTKLGHAIAVLGIRFWPIFWGFMASFAEFFGAMCLMLGLWFRPACALMAFTMFVASAMHLSQGHGLETASHAIELLVVFVGLFLIGPGSAVMKK